MTFPAGGTIFIGDSVQFEARETLSDGTTRVVTNEATWGSDAPAVATVSSTGLVTAVAPGEATIFADVNPRGSLLIRVFPNFGGSWMGSEVIAGCEDSGALEGVCRDRSLAVGEVFLHRSMFSQTQASVNAVIDGGEGNTATATGNVTVGGELQLPSTPFLPGDPTVSSQLQNWRSRADVPSQMTGTWELFLTAPGVQGSVTLMIRLQDVIKTSATSTSLTNRTLRDALRKISLHLESLR
ncbi:MAG TPA: Ig-like domain-containing protein [Vicinamibacteria bacterium]|nr:Ig-like domain-containing protein [Vicinamibacteria bacterium]